MKRHLSCFLFLIGQITLWAQAVPTPAPTQSQAVFIENATIHIGNGKVLEKASILFDKGKIEQVGTNISGKSGAKKIDAKGKHIYPGFITANSNVGLAEIEAVRATLDQSETGIFNSNARAIVGYNTDSKVIPTVRSNGVLIAQIAPQGGLFSGTAAVVQLDAWHWEDAAYQADNGIYLNYPNVSVDRQDENNPVDEQQKEIARQENAIHQTLKDAVAYRQAKESGKWVAHNQMLEALMPLLKKEKKLFIRAYTEKQIIKAVTLGQEYGLSVVIVGGQDAWLQTELLKKYEVPVILYKPHQLPRLEDDDVDLPYKLPNLLKKAGVVFCFDMDEFWNERNLPFQAGTAVAHGLGKEDAISAISLQAAQILGIDKTTGSLEVGKDATLIISQGDVLDMRTSIITDAFIQGRKIDLNNMQSDLYKKYNNSKQ
ncbi:MAG: amidohydrolase family protein [Bacteroidia bacterium]